MIWYTIIYIYIYTHVQIQAFYVKLWHPGVWMRGDQLVGRGARVVHANGTRSICNFLLGAVHQLKKRSWSFVHSTALNTTRSSVAHQEMQHQSHQSLQLRKPWILVRRESIRHRGFEYFLDDFWQWFCWSNFESGCEMSPGVQPSMDTSNGRTRTPRMTHTIKPGEGVGDLSFAVGSWVSS